MAKETPPYYLVTPDGDDLYNAFLLHYGQEATLQHLEMEVLQYLWRCRVKGDYDTDIRKARVILQRIEALRATVPPETRGEST